MAKKKETKHRGTEPSSRDAAPQKWDFLYRQVLPALGIVAVILLVIGAGASLTKPDAGQPTSTVKAAATVDPCSPEFVRDDVEKVHALMLEFYDASALASQTPSDQLVQVIPPLQEIRRRAESLKVYGCLDTLRSYQISHMNMVINTLLAFMSKSDQAVLVEGIVQARLLNEEYQKEKARLLGEKYLPPATWTPKLTAGTPTLQPSTKP